MSVVCGVSDTNTDSVVFFPHMKAFKFSIFFKYEKCLMRGTKYELVQMCGPPLFCDR